MFVCVSVVEKSMSSEIGESKWSFLRLPFSCAICVGCLVEIWVMLELSLPSNKVMGIEVVYLTGKNLVYDKAL